jgi:hypothetical protein
MNRTEERLTDALADSYTRLRERPLHPLTVPPPRPHRKARWLAPVAAAAAVAVVAVGVTTLTGHTHAGRPNAGASTGLRAASLFPAPRYYVDMNYYGQVAVRSRATGAVTATVPVPRLPQGPAGVLASASGGVFYATAFGTQSGERLYRFQVTGTGQVTGFATVPVGPIAERGYAEAMAVSPDGSQLAVAVTGAGADRYASITVFTLRTGARQVWQGGLAQPGYATFDISGLSWIGPQQLVFSAQWCQVAELNNEVCFDAAKGGQRLSAVRSLELTGSGGQLSQGRLLLGQSARYPAIVTAVASAYNRTLTAVVLSGPTSPGAMPGRLTVVRFSPSGAAPGELTVAPPYRPGQPRVLYQRATGAVSTWVLSPDSSGQYWLLGGSARSGPGGFNGWLSGRQFTALPSANGGLVSEGW